jgi:hypothetical protein
MAMQSGLAKITCALGDEMGLQHCNMAVLVMVTEDVLVIEERMALLAESRNC